MRSKVIPRPLNRPHKNPAIKGVITTMYQGAPALATTAKIINDNIMIEPTDALAIKDLGKVLDLIYSLKKTGVGVLVISHRMDDIFTVCDRLMALFQGTNFAESSLSNTSRDEVIGWIMGKK